MVKPPPPPPPAERGGAHYELRGHLDKIEKEQQKVEPKKLSAFSGYSNFKADICCVVIFNAWNSKIYTALSH